MAKAGEMHVLHVVLSLSPGGTERLVIEMATRMASGGNASVCCLDEPGVWSQELTDRGIPVIGLGRQPGFHPLLGYRIGRLAERLGADVIHCHHYSPFVYSSIAAVLRKRLPVVFTEHGRLSDAPPTLKRRLVNPVLARIPRQVVAVSADLRDYMIRDGFPAERVEVIHNGIDVGPKPDAAERRVARRLLGLSERAVVFGTVGRLDTVKDLGTLVDAFAAVRMAIPDPVALVIIGDGAELDALQVRVRAHDLGDAVCFLGYRQDVRRLLPALDVYVNSSIHEGVSLTIVEAMAAALPVVATAVGGNPEVVVDQQTGMLVLPRDPRALADALLTLAASGDSRRSMGDRGRLRAEQSFTIDRMVDQYYRAYAAAVGCRDGKTMLGHATYL